VLFRGGRRDAEWLVVDCAEFDAVGLGVDDILMADSSYDISDISSLMTTVIVLRIG